MISLTSTRFSFTGILICLCVTAGCNGAPSASPDEITTVAQALRGAIDKKYDSMEQAHALKPMGGGVNVITDTVVEFIPRGTPFVKAGEILRRAGFEMSVPSMDSTTGLVELGAVLRNYKSLGFGVASIVVTLRPEDYKDWRSVGSLDAHILCVYL